MILRAEPLSPEAFAPWGDVLDARGEPDRIINQGLCGRFHDRARLDFGSGRAGLSVFRAETRTLPLQVAMVERHPEGSQAFLPLHADPFLVVVAEGRGAAPGRLRAFVTAPHQGVNLLRGAWHGVLAPLGCGLFAVLDRVGEGPNLEEHWLAEPATVQPPDGAARG